MARYCPECERVMERDTSSGAVAFRCYCGVTRAGAPVDALIGEFVLNTGETTQMYRRLIESAAHGRVNKKVMRDCPECGRDYMTQIRVGKNELVIWKCVCGHQSSKYEPPPEPAPAEDA